MSIFVFFVFSFSKNTFFLFFVLFFSYDGKRQVVSMDFSTCVKKGPSCFLGGKKGLHYYFEGFRRFFFVFSQLCWATKSLKGGFNNSGSTSFLQARCTHKKKKGRKEKRGKKGIQHGTKYINIYTVLLRRGQVTTLGVLFGRFSKRKKKEKREEKLQLSVNGTMLLVISFFRSFFHVFVFFFGSQD